MIGFICKGKSNRNVEDIRVWVFVCRISLCDVIGVVWL